MLGCGFLGTCQDIVGLGLGLEHILLVGLFDVHGFGAGGLGLVDLLVRGFPALVENGQNFIQEELLHNEHLDKQVADGGNQGKGFHCHKGLIKCLH